MEDARRKGTYGGSNFKTSKGEAPEWAIPTERQKQTKFVLAMGADPEKANKASLLEAYERELIANRA